MNIRNPSLWLLLLLIAVVVLAIMKTSGLDHNRAWTIQPEGIMGTSSRISVVADPSRAETAAAILDAAEKLLRQDETLLSSWIEDSEISRLNRAAAAEIIALSGETLELLRQARLAHEFTRGAFDITVGPLIGLWREAGRSGVLPDSATVVRVRAVSRWDLIELLAEGAMKSGGEARVDLGGIAKGYALDRALEVIRKSGFPGGMVDVGGDICFFGDPPGSSSWKVEVRHPFQDGILMTLHLSSGAVCTSGNYARFSRIGGMKYSHILDPRTGYPAEGIPSISVIAPTALQADIWATALSVLGPEGFDLLPDAVEACMVRGSADSFRLIATAGFADRIVGEKPQLEIR